MRTRRAVGLGIVLAALAAGSAQAAPELSVSERLKDRRYVAAGERTRVIGFEDGRFYANGWHIAGEMGGVWSEPLKLVDGVWFGIDDEWIGPATSFRSGWGYAEMDLPTTAGLQVQRTDFAPDGHRAALFGLKLTNPGAAARTVTVKVDAHSELLAEYPWSFDNTPHARDQLPDTAAFDGDALVFREQGKLPHPNATVHDYAALVAADRDPVAGETGMSANGYRGPQGTNVCSAQELPSLCDDGPFGKGQGGQLRYAVTVPAGGSETLWVAVAGSDEGRVRRAAGTRRRPARIRPRSSRTRSRRASAGAAGTKLSLPGDRRLQAAVDWGKQNILDLTRVAEDLQIRGSTRAGSPRRPPGRSPVPAGSAPATRTIRGCRRGRRVHGVRERRGRPVRADQGPPARAAQGIRHPQRRLGRRDPRGDLRGRQLVRPRLAPHGSRDGRDQVRLQHRRDRQVPERRGADLALDGRQRVPRRDVRLLQAQPALRRGAARRGRRRLAGGLGQRGARRHGRGEARQLGLPDPRPLRPGGHGAAPSATGVPRDGR